MPGLTAIQRKTINDALAQGTGNNLAELAKLIDPETHEVQAKTVTGATVTVDWSGNNSHNQRLDIAAATTVSFTNPDKPCRLKLEVKENSTGGFAVTLPTIKNTADAAPTTPTTTANKRSVYYLDFDGTSYYLIREITNMS